MSTRFTVAVHTLTAITLKGGQPIRSEDIASSVRTNPTVIRSLLSRLTDAGLTTSRLGTGGGALLARPAGQIRLLDIYRAVEEGEIFPLQRCPPNQHCPIGRTIQGVIQPTLDRARSAMEHELALITIADIAAEVAGLADFDEPTSH